MKTSSLEILEKAQLPPEQARAIFKVMEMEFDDRWEALATKAELQALELRLEARMDRLESRLVAWVFGTFLALAALLSTELHFVLGRFGR